MGNSKHQLPWNKNIACGVCGSQSIICFCGFSEFSRSDRLFSVHSSFHMLFEVVSETSFIYFLFIFHFPEGHFYISESRNIFSFSGAAFNNHSSPTHSLFPKDQTSLLKGEKLGIHHPWQRKSHVTCVTPKNAYTWHLEIFQRFTLAFIFQTT